MGVNTLLTSQMSHLTWYVARAGGIIAWATCTASIIWGLTLSTRVIKRRGIPAWLLDLHRFLGALTIVFTVLHLGGLYFDTYAHFGFRDMLVPMATSWRPGAVAWGIVAFYLLLAIQITSLVMKRIPRKLWRAVHMTSVALFVTGTVHGLLAGADAANRLVQWVLVGTTAIALFLVFLRIAARNEPAENPRTAAVRAAAARAKGPATEAA